MNKKLLFVRTGGTIASRYDPASGYAPALDSAELLSDIGQFSEGVEIVSWNFSDILSFSFTPQMLLDLIAGIQERMRQGEWFGAVVTQGTSLLEETSFLADLFWKDERPLVFTGAMLNSSERDWDGPRNIRNAILTAMSPEAKNMGALVCLGGEIHAARDATKIHKTSLSPISGGIAGALGLVINENRAVFYRAPTRRVTFEPLLVEQSVEIVKVAMGSGGGVIDALVAEGCKAIVLEALPGGGGVTPAVFEAVQKNIDRVLFVQCPRSPGGSTIAKAGGGCGPFDLRRLGVLTAGDLSSVKARILLMAALPHLSGRKELAALFEKVCP